MEPLDFRSLKQTAREVIDAQRKTSGRLAVVFFLLLNALQLLISYLSGLFVALPSFETAEDLMQYFAAGHTDSLLKLFGFEAASMLLSILFSGVFSAYCLKIAQGQPADRRTLRGSLGTVWRFALLFLLLVLAVLVLCMLLSALSLLSVTVGMLCSVLLSVGAVVVFYVLRPLLFSVAENKNIFSAVRECARLTSGHKKGLFLLDFSYLWFVILIALIPSVISGLPYALADAAVSLRNASLFSWVNDHFHLLELAGTVLGVIAILPLYYRFYTSIRLTYALVYQKLKSLPAPQKETQPLAYKEFPGSEL